MLTRMDELGALLSDIAPILFQDSGEREMDENFISSDMTTYINYFFDVLNSKSPLNYNPRKIGFGKNLELQLKEEGDM